MRKNSFYFFGFVSFMSFLILLCVYYLQFFNLAAECKLCAYQRVPYFVIIAISIAAYFFKKFRNSGILLIVACFLISTALSAFHVAVEKKVVYYNSSCTSSDLMSSSIEELKSKLESKELVSCDQVSYHLFEVSLAMWNLIVSIMLLLFGLNAAFSLSQRGKYKSLKRKL